MRFKSSRIASSTWGSTTIGTNYKLQSTLGCGWRTNIFSLLFVLLSMYSHSSSCWQKGFSLEVKEYYILINILKGCNSKKTQLLFFLNLKQKCALGITIKTLENVEDPLSIHFSMCFHDIISRGFKWFCVLLGQNLKEKKTTLEDKIFPKHFPTQSHI